MKNRMADCRACGEYLKPKTIVLGGDARLTSESLKRALAKGLQDAALTCWISVCRHRRDLLRHLPPRRGRRYRSDRQP
ncbi:phosphomannomutase [Salmonella enterica subsp. houtenae]|nr:phosphomannomutase [Salmonella enterica subsp. houtenae]